MPDRTSIHASSAVILAASMWTIGCAGPWSKPDPGPRPGYIPGTEPTVAAAALGSSPPPASPIAEAFSKLTGWMKPKPEAPKASAPTMVGTVALVSPEERFVLIDVTSLIAASPGTDVITIADSRETSQMKISRERRNPFVIADLISGAPKVGERVFAVPAAASTLPHP